MSRRTKVYGLLASAAAATLAANVQAAPFVNTWMEASTASNGTYGATVTNVTAGQTLFYKVWIDVASIGTVNQQGTAAAKTITALTPGTDGVANTKFNIFEDASAPIQVNFGSAGTLDASWNSVTGASGGTVTARTGSAGNNDLVGVRPGQNTTFMAIDPVVMVTGSFVVAAAPASSTSFVGMTATNSVATALKVNGASVFPSATTEKGLDPYLGFTALTLQTAGGPVATGTSRIHLDSSPLGVNLADNTNASENPGAAVAGAINVQRNGPGAYVSEIDGLTANGSNGAALIGGNGVQAPDPSYVMLWLTGQTADISALLADPTLDLGGGTLVTNADPQFAILQAQYQLPGNDTWEMLIKYPSGAGIAGNSVSWNLGNATGVQVDAVAVVPEPATIGLLGLAGLGVMARRRRKA